MPSVDTAKRSELVEAIADIVLEHGLDALALRGLAVRLSTSGRMLLYYFGTKDVLVREVLEAVAGRMRHLQDAASRGPRVTPGQFLAEMMRAGLDPRTAPFMRIWTDVIVRAARDEAPYRDIAERTVAAWLDWIGVRLIPAPDNEARAGTILAIMEGVTILENARPGTTRRARDLLPSLLDAAPRHVTR